MKQLTERQRAILAYVEEYARQTGFRPTLDEVRRHFGLQSINGAVVHIKALERKGYLQALEMIRKSPATPAVMIPVLGTVAAGKPILAEEHIEKWIFFSPPSSGRHDYFGLIVKGDSMIDASILPGDIVIVCPQPDADSGDIVVALFGDEATVKTLYKGEDGIRLVPANPRYHPIPVTEETHILGTVVGLVREHIDSVHP
ncbi:MAG: transcriptional repressor LexA [Candidatus Cryosericum sp.]